MFRWKKIHQVLSVYSLLISTSAIITALVIFQIPSEPGKVIFLGVSLQRLIVMGGMFFVGILLAGFALKAFHERIWAEQIWFSIFGRQMLARGIRWGAVAGVILGWIIYFMPLYRWGDYQGYYLRVSPVIFWLMLVSMLTFVVSWIEKYGFHWVSIPTIFGSQKKVLSITLIALTLFCLIWVLIAVTGMGLWVSDGYWYGAGVPILELQVLLAMAIGLGVFFLEKSRLSIHFSARLDILIFLLLWGLTAFFWVHEPLPRSFFAPGPYPPDFQYYPYSDAATFDIASQFALIGQGINNGVYFDRALYMAFLVFLHKFAGQDYVQVMALQAAILAVFPGILYLLGKAIHSRAFAMTLSILVLMRGINGIAASTMIDLANQKQMLTDFPTVIFAALFTLMLIKWLKAPAQNYLYLVWAGGIIGLAIMLRTNTLFLMLLAAVLIGIIYRYQKVRGMLVGILVVLAMFASTFAWGAYKDKSIFDIYIYRILLVIQARYPQPSVPQGSEIPLYNIAAQPTDGEVSFPVKTLFRPRTTLLDHLSSNRSALAATELKPIPVFVTIHFLHNIIASVFILPTTPIFHDLEHIVKEIFPFWESYWAGGFTLSAHFFLMVNLFLIALGIGVSWRSAKLPGLVPLGVFVFYDLANAFARTSGGRYVVPIDWIVLLYFALGLFQIILWGMTLFGLPRYAEKIANVQDEIESAPWIWEPFKRAPLIILFFLFIGTLLPLSEQFFPRLFSVEPQAKLFAFLERDGYVQNMGFDSATLKTASVQWPNFKIIKGRALYPRYFTENMGIPKNRYPYNIMEFPRIAFTMIGPKGVNYVVLPQDRVPYFPNASDVIVLGCQEGTSMDALAVVVNIEEQTVVYVRQPASTLQCPLQQPVCNDNHVCR